MTRQHAYELMCAHMDASIMATVNNPPQPSLSQRVADAWASESDWPAPPASMKPLMVLDPAKLTHVERMKLMGEGYMMRGPVNHAG